MSAAPRIRSFARFQTQLLFLILLVVVPALGLIIYGNLEQQRIEQERTRDGAEAISNLAAANQLNLIQQTRQLLATLVEFPFLVAATNVEFCQTHFSNLQKILPDYVNFGLIERDGSLFSAGTPIKRPVLRINDRFIDQVIQTKRFAIGTDEGSLATDRASLNIAYPVLDKQKQVQRVIFASLNRSLFSEMLAPIRLPAGASITTIDGQGNVLARQPDAQEWVGKSLLDLPMTRKIHDPTNPIFKAMGSDGHEQLVAVSRIDDGQASKLFVAVTIPLNVSIARLRALFIRNLLILGSVSLIVLLAARFYARRFFLSPIRKLVSTANRIAAGDLQARTGVLDDSTELDQLAMRFDFMAASLLQRHLEIERQKEEIVKMNADLESRVSDRTERLAVMNRELEAFSYSVSHDLRAPIRHMDGFGELLQKHSGQALDEKGTRYLRLIRESSKRMGNLIDDLLLFSKIGRDELRQARFSMAELVKDSIKALEPDTQGRSIEWIIEALPDVVGDQGMFRQVWMNLIGNAIKYTRKQDVARINIGWKVEQIGEAIFFIRDNGVGFQMQYVGKLFGVFQRLHNESEFEGTGVGLANVRRIVSRHSGRSWAEGEPGKGACFFFSVNDPSITTR